MIGWEKYKNGENCLNEPEKIRADYRHYYATALLANGNMRYELYSCLRDSDAPYDAIIYILSSNSIDLIREHIEHKARRKDEFYIIVDNQTPFPVDHAMLGLRQPPTNDELYMIIENCKQAKMRELVPHDMPDGRALFELIDELVERGEAETKKYFDRLDKLKNR